MNVLVIDDDPEDRALFFDALHEQFTNMVFTGVDSCAHMKETIERVAPDIIFIDGHMQPTSGAECLTEINNVIDRDKIKVIIHSGSLSPTELREFEKIGVDHILVKASSFQELKSNIQHVLEKFYPHLLKHG